MRPNDTAEDANPDLSAVIVTNMGEARNAIIVWSADAVIAIGGWTLLDQHSNPLHDPVTHATSPQEAR